MALDEENRSQVMEHTATTTNHNGDISKSYANLMMTKNFKGRENLRISPIEAKTMYIENIEIDFECAIFESKCGSSKLEG